MAKKKTHEEFVEELKKIDPTITLLSEYTGAHNKIKWLCNVCNKEQTSCPAYLLRNHGCKYCQIIKNANKRRLTHDAFIQKLQNINPNINVLEEYKGHKYHISVQCTVCGNIWSPKANYLLSGNGCPKCAIERNAQKLRITNDEFLNRIKDVSLNIEVIGEYKGYNAPILVKCLKCNNEYFTKPHYLLDGHGCKKCSSEITGDKLKKSNTEFLEELKDINPEIDILSDYINSKTNVKCKCKKCGNIWYATPNNLLRGSRCSDCYRFISKGEDKIKMFLTSSNIDYISQKRYDNLFGVGDKCLSYDFYLPDYNVLIEAQGQQHEKPIEIFGGEEQFKIQQEHDKRKREYAMKNNIKLLEIWYWDYDRIEEILSKELNIKELDVV